ncbi:terminase [Burkholderia multivorans]|uniref:Terminase n=1 Tax=Burkholderia multivorans TaxID=87883 RepID=A0AAP2HJJ8_9BURK|nr:terminase [Burkholderia multivorans]MBU9366553.1 terminase [Burkholderia multivorans]MBU9514471.1 terminase [Burkholderia multivorans]MBU9526154.1 terminase [Burkholderia multivorans]MBU9690562.1 terminase [Burkholderia multivorans]
MTEYKNETKNHAINQILRYRIGDKEAYKRPDDLFDAFSYGVIYALVPQMRKRD